MKKLTHHYDICVVGGGLAGMCAAIAAARHGSKVALVHDRPVFGGNASSEIRMWPLGAHGSNRRETGIFEELVLENMSVNPMRTYPNWDAVLYSAIYEQENLDCFMNCTVNDLQTENGKITQITGWQLTTYTTHTITADLFIDCSGDSILAQLSGAEPDRLWESNIFGKSVYEMIRDGLNTKLVGLPQEVRAKLRGTLTRVVNEGANGLICLIL